MSNREKLGRVQTQLRSIAATLTEVANNLDDDARVHELAALTDVLHSMATHERDALPIAPDKVYRARPDLAIIPPSKS